MELGPDRDGKACGFGCWTLGALLVADGFDASEREFGAGTVEAEPPARSLLSSMLATDRRRRH
jgi:hypothetical protein